MSDKKDACLQIYDGYGHTEQLRVFGSVYRGRPAKERRFTKGIWKNIIKLVGLFMVKPLFKVPVRLHWQGLTFDTLTEKDGFFYFEWKSPAHIPAGWHTLTIEMLDQHNKVIKEEKGRVFVPHITQYAFISDIDDTVMVSHSSTKIKRLVELLTRHPQRRKLFEATREFYQGLALTGTGPGVPNPFFYVSSSEWNLYFDLKSFFAFNRLPEGIFLLSQMKRWFQLFKTGQTKHITKLQRIFRMMEAFPNQQYVLLGDNSQADPEIYATIADKFPDRIYAIYIRNMRPSKLEAAQNWLNNILAKENIHTMIFNHTGDAMDHAKKIGLLRQADNLI